MLVAAVLATGLSYALAQPPFDVGPLGWLCLVPLLLAVRRQPLGSAVRLGVLGGYACGWCTQWWLADSVRQYWTLPAPAAVAFIAAGHLVVWGAPVALFTAGVAAIRDRVGPAMRPPLVAAAWVAAELVRARVIGQPWALLGYSQHATLPLLQIATVTGVYGVSFLLALVAAALAEAVPEIRRAPRTALAPLSWVAIPAVVWAAGVFELRSAPGDARPHEVVVVQSNLDPARHWTRAYGEAQLRAQLRLSEAQSAAGPPKLVVWPENAVARYPERDPLVAARLAGLARRLGADVLFGAPRIDGARVYNSARLIRGDRGDWQHYDKRRLVPFAEERLFARERPPAPDSPETFSRGSGSGALDGFVRLGVSICHEIVHPDLVRASVRDGARLLVNIANDGLLDLGWGIAARQHVAMAAFRAVETRRFLVRAATTGESVVVDPYGRIVARLPRGVAGALRASVGEGDTLTLYTRAGDLFAALCLAASLAAAARPSAARRRRRLALAPV